MPLVFFGFYAGLTWLASLIAMATNSLGEALSPHGWATDVAH
jgi:hypothetical protein